jgi:hypothetical protein
MRRVTTVAALFLALMGLTAQSALAANVHFKAKPPLTFFDNGKTLTVSGALTGLGNGDIRVTITATAQPVAGCVNPGSGEHRPAGQQPAVVQVGGTTDIPNDQIKNGNVPFSVTTVEPTLPSDPRTAGCPGTNWTVVLDDVIFLAVKISVFQDSNPNGVFDPPGTLVLGPVCFSLSGPSSGTSGPLTATSTSC